MYTCPVLDCPVEFKNVDAIVGHVAGKAPHDEAHEEYGELRRFEFKEQYVASRMF